MPQAQPFSDRADGGKALGSLDVTPAAALPGATQQPGVRVPLNTPYDRLGPRADLSAEPGSSTHRMTPDICLRRGGDRGSRGASCPLSKGAAVWGGGDLNVSACQV